MARIKIGNLHGLNGTNGLDGKSAYQAALDCGATSCTTETEWIQSITQCVSYIEQALTNAQKEQARENIDAVSIETLNTLIDEIRLLIANSGGGGGGGSVTVDPILTFTNNVNTVEIGRTINDVTLTYTLRSIPRTVKLDNVLQNILTETGTFVFTNQGITTNKTYSLEVIDSSGNTSTKTTAIRFLRGVYYGTGEVPELIDSTFILGLGGISLQSTKAITRTINATNGKFIWIALPTSYGVPSFTVGGFSGGFENEGEIQLTNSSGYSESYTIYKSENSGLGSTTIIVS